MKQHITTEQLNELSEKGRESLRKWWKPKRGDWFAEKDFVNYPEEEWESDLLEEYDRFWYLTNLSSLQEFTEYVKTNGVQTLLPLLSIGQLIEFLDNEKRMDIERDVNTSTLYRDKMTNENSSGTFLLRFNYPFIDIETHRNIEMCDALFHAVKEVLET